MIPYHQFETFSLGGITLYVWGVFAGLGFIVGSILFRLYLPKPFKQNADLFSVLIFLSGLIGARFVYVLSHREQAESIAAGGLGFVGGLMIGGGVAYALIRLWRWPVKETLDALAVGLSAGYTIGRIGCFLIHDHIGKPTNVAWGINVNGQTFHETSLYSFLNGFILFAVLFIIARRKPKPGTIALLFVLWYSLVRFGIDFFQVGPYIHGLTFTQFFLIPVFGAALVAAKRMARRSL